MRLARRFTPLGLLLASAGSLAAQDTTGILLGNVTMLGSGRPLAGARITLRSSSLLGERHATTDAQGGYRIPLLPNGEYTLSVAKAGFSGGSTKVVVTAGRTIRQDVRLQDIQEAQSARVEVTALAPQVDKTETTTQSTFSQESLSQLLSSDLNNALNLSPGVTGNGYSPSIRGGNSASVKFLVNGLSANHVAWGLNFTSAYLLQDMVESWSVIQSPLNARYGNTESGVVSAVTKRGNNAFQGSLRVSYGRSGAVLKSVDLTQAMRDGSGVGYPNPGDDATYRNYQATFSGPLIRDRLTFAWGGHFTPSTRSNTTRYFGYNSPSYITDIPNYKNTTGTLYTDPSTGVEFRKAYIGDHKAVVPLLNKSEFNQYALFWQVGEGHSLEYTFSQSFGSGLEYYGNETSLSGNSTSTNRSWNVGYKGILGGDGVLEARVGRQTFIKTLPTTPGRYPITASFYATWETDGSPNGKPNYTSPLQAWDSQSGPTASFFGIDNDTGETHRNDSRFLNYQKLVSWHGSHNLDLGYGYESASWDTMAAGAPYSARVPGGMLAPDLRDNGKDVVRGNFTGAIDLSYYAGKWVMWPVGMPLNALDPAYSASATLGDLRGRYFNLVPTLTIREGLEQGTFSQATDSLWLNDLWTLNAHHSVMLGLRMDRFKLKDATGTKHRYSFFTPRMEWKWDLYGDQARVLSASFGRFHNRQPLGLFLGFVQRRLGYASTWRFDAGTTPQLFTPAQVLDPKYYNTLASASFPGSAVLDPNWKADYSDEIAINFRRAYENGGFWRASIVARKWHNSFRWMPMAPVNPVNPYNPKVASSRPVLPSLLTNEEHEIYHTYRSFELEWNAPVSQRLSFSGNYTFARNVNNTPKVTDSPISASAEAGTPPPNWDWYLSRYVAQSVLQQPWSQANDHVFKARLFYDLTVGPYKSSVALLGNYASGPRFQRTNSWQLPTVPKDLIPGYTDLGYTTGIPRSVSVPVGIPGSYIGSESMSFSLKYNLEIPVGKSFRWWAGIEVREPFQHIWTMDVDAGGSNFQDKLVGQDPKTAMLANGWRMTSSVVDKVKVRRGLRSVVIESGIRF